VKTYLAAAVVAAAALTGTPTKTVKVGDDYYGPAKLTVKRGTTVRWRWLADNADSHDVKLAKAPKGVKRFRSASAATDYTYSRKLTTPGTYRFVCSLHQDMTMTVTVK
jgi:plastocyanin